MTPETLVQVGSITKTLTATAALRLIDEGKLELYAPVRHYLPDWRIADGSSAEQVQIVHLLQHTAGFDGAESVYADPYDWADSALNSFVQNMHELRQISPVGHFFDYNNAGYSLLGHLIARLAEDASRRRFMLTRRRPPVNESAAANPLILISQAGDQDFREMQAGAVVMPWRGRPRVQRRVPHDGHGR